MAPSVSLVVDLIAQPARLSAYPHRLHRSFTERAERLHDGSERVLAHPAWSWRPGK